ncbi:MAG: lactate utilization protein [Bifidobacteriaceae bacterium]|jgi:hypothetical protein|nr:lactate utilization protein [Bifidobacteriaceae bacterium]
MANMGTQTTKAVEKKQGELLSAGLIRAFESRQMQAFAVDNANEAIAKVLEIVPKGATFASGGSMTLADIGVQDALVEKGCEQIDDRSVAKSKEEDAKIRRNAFFADYFLMSTNAFSKDGQLVNIDGIGNRVAALAFGPRNVIVVTGINKLADDLDAAVKRARQTAAVRNVIRMNLDKTGCKGIGKCMDCKMSDCICAHIVITRFSRLKGRITVIIVNENLGY